MHTAIMPNVTIRNLDPQAHAVFVRRAAAAGQSLQQYLKEQLTELAENPTEAELIARLEEAAWPLTSRTLTTEEIVADLRAARGE